MVQELLTAGIAAAAGVAVYAGVAARVVRQYERGLVFRFGRLREGIRGPGFTMILPFIDRLLKVNMQIVTLPVPAQEGITRDNVTVRVDAVVYFKVVDPANAIIEVEDYRFAVSQMAQTSLRSIIGKSDLDDLLSNREQLNQGLELMIDSPAVGWGVQIDRVEIKDVSLPETMKRSMARQAEADRERRARVINADAELQASRKLAEAAAVMSEQPAALQLRLLQTVVAVAAEKNSTLVLPFPVELLRFLERAAPAQTAPDPAATPPRKASPPPAPAVNASPTSGPALNASSAPDHPALNASPAPDPAVDGTPDPEPPVDGSPDADPARNGSLGPGAALNASPAPDPAVDGSPGRGPALDGSGNPGPTLDGSPEPGTGLDGSPGPGPSVDGSPGPDAATAPGTDEAQPG